MSQWDNCEINEAIRLRQMADQYNQEASHALPVEEQTRTSKVRTVINRRSGVKHTETLFEYNTRMAENCVKRFWTRTPRSNSNSFVFHTVQNDSSNWENVQAPITISTTLYKG